MILSFSKGFSRVPLLNLCFAEFSFACNVWKYKVLLPFFYLTFNSRGYNKSCVGVCFLRSFYSIEFLNLLVVCISQFFFYLDSKELDICRCTNATSVRQNSESRKSSIIFGNFFSAKHHKDIKM